MKGGVAAAAAARLGVKSMSRGYLSLLFSLALGRGPFACTYIRKRVCPYHGPALELRGPLWCIVDLCFN